MIKNKLKRGIKASNKLKKSFYHFLFEKHIDWAILLSCFLLMLPYIGSKNILFLIARVSLFLISTYFIFQYILLWKELDSFKKIWENTISKLETLIVKDKIKDIKKTTTRDKIEEFIKNISEIWPELKLFVEKKISADELKQRYPNQISRIEDIINEDKDLTLTIVGASLIGLALFQTIQNIPVLELKNYKRILLIILITIIFFGVYTLEISIN